MLFRGYDVNGGSFEEYVLISSLEALFPSDESEFSNSPDYTVASHCSTRCVHFSVDIWRERRLDVLNPQAQKL